jgi:alpha-D-ribose 1-methylphosphonate 5-triphosphate synthase subunit PhnG
VNRAERLSTLALATSFEIEGLWASVSEPPAFSWIREPEFASVMIRGRVSAQGSAFNLGEAVITRCVIQLDELNAVGVGYLIGRRRRLATLVALLDAITQTNDELSDKLRTAISRLPAFRASRRSEVEREIAGSQVDFSMLLRSEET